MVGNIISRKTRGRGSNMIFTANVSRYEVKYDNSLGVYQIIEDEAVIKESKSFTVIDKFITNGGESEKKDKPKRLNKEAIINDYREYYKAIITSVAESRYNDDYRKYYKATITSVAESRYNDVEVWIVIDGKREKKELKYLIDYTPENLDIIKEIKKLEQDISKLGDVKLRLEKTLTPVTLDMLQEGR